ncbi:MAG: thioredoxin [Nitrososphaerales archaeon]
MSDPELEKILKEKVKSIKEMNKKVKQEGPLNLTSNNFYNIINSEKPVIIDFWAEWCAPCMTMLPVFEKLAKKYDGKMVFGRLNVDENGEISNRYQVFSIPTFIIFVKGKPVDIVVGAVGERSLEKTITKHVE